MVKQLVYLVNKNRIIAFQKRWYVPAIYEACSSLFYVNYTYTCLFFKAVKYGKEIYKINYEVTMVLAPKSHLGIIYLLLTLKGWFGYYIKSKRYNCLLTPQKKGNFQNYFAHVQDFTNHIPKKNLDVIYNGNQDLKKPHFRH